MVGVIAGFLGLGTFTQTQALDANGSKTPSLSLVEQWSNVFGGRETVYHFRVDPSLPAARLEWRFAAGPATLQRGEHAVPAGNAAVGGIEVRLAVPTVKDGIIQRCDLTAALMAVDSGKLLGSVKQPIWIFPENPFADRQEWLKSLKIQLFDPEKTTATVFTDTGIPFEPVTNLAAVDGLKSALLIVGADVSMRDYPALAATMTRAASRGLNVLVLEPAVGSFHLPELRQLTFRRADVIASLDKRLDAIAWPADGNIRASGARLLGERGPVSLELAADATWPWVEMKFDRGGTLVVCGFSIVRKWNTSPAPRYLLARVLEQLSSQSKNDPQP